MRAVFVLLVVFFVGVLCEQQYTSKYDNVNLESIIENDRLLKNYVNCLLEKGKCTSDAAELKRTIPDALATDCSKCSEKQKAGMRKMIRYLSVNRREWWNQLLQKYDPDGAYQAKYADLIQKEGIQV